MGNNRSKRRSRRIDLLHHDIPTKANRILHLILIAISLIVVRVWYLAVIQYDQKLEDSRKPQRKSVIEPAIRATIRDRFNIPLAINKISYQATILYADLKDIPTIAWHMDASGKRTKVFKRREYIRQLSELLGRELLLEADRIEDLIHAKASYYSQVPFIIKDDLSENEFYHLRMLEKDWPGMHMRRAPKRYYPQDLTGSDIIGYMGAINRQEYEKILHEMKVLQQFIKERENGEEGELPYGIETTVQARNRLKDLEEKAYTIHDYVGKTGIEGYYEEQLRGFYGKKHYYSDSKGNHLWELPGSKAPLAGQRVLLTISAELQAYAEQLLAQNEEFRLVRKSSLGPIKKTILALKTPWIKGGAIVAMEPFSGEILALASYPRFDPNDFIVSAQPEQQKIKKSRINRWFENEHYLSDLWNMQQPFERERFDPNSGLFYEEQRWLTWPNFLDFILPQEGLLRDAVIKMRNLSQAVEIQRLAAALTNLLPDEEFYTLLNYLYEDDFHTPHHPLTKSSEKNKFLEKAQKCQAELNEIKHKLDQYFSKVPHNYDKVLMIDLARLAVNEESFNSELLNKVGVQTIDSFRLSGTALFTIMAVVKEMAKGLFHDHDFQIWRKKEEKDFLKQKRLDEKAAKTYPKPYIDYIDQMENQFFQSFWEKYKWPLLMTFLNGKQIAWPFFDNNPEDLTPYLEEFDRWYREIDQGAHKGVAWKNSYATLQKSIKPLSAELAIDYLQTMRPYQELTRPLLGRYRGLRNQKAPLEKHLATAFYPVYGYGYGRSHAFRQATIQGSLFKIVTAYEALMQRYRKLDGKICSLNELNPLTISDNEFMKGQTRFMGYTDDGRPIPQLYKGGRLPRSLAHRNTGRVDLIKALEFSSNPYFSMLAGDCLEHPSDLVQAASNFGFGKHTGIGLPGEICGKVPNDVEKNRTGLYALAIGQHSLVVTPLQTAVMLSAIANRGKILKPKIVNLLAGMQPMHGDNSIPSLPSFPYQESLSLIGVDFPLFTGAFSQNQNSLVKQQPTEVRHQLLMPEMVRKIILKGLHASVQRSYQGGLDSLAKLYKEHPDAIKQFKAMKDQLLGKTSTSESVENLDLDLEEGTNIYTHVWFGGIVYDAEKSDQNKSTFIFQDEFGKPELVVVVYLRYGGYGKEAAPLAAQIAKRWRDIKLQHR
jgi:cell division protein FtsI/penicillin-binding protein 2